MIFTTVLLQLISLLLIAAIGFLLAKLGYIDGKISKGMGNILTKACLPCLLISNMQFDFDSGLLADMGIAAGAFVLVMLISALLVVPVLLAKKVSQREAGIWIICVSVPNVVYIGKPIMDALYGETAAMPITGIVLIFNLIVFSVGILLVSMGEKNERVGVGALLKRSFVNPTVISGIVGILLFLFSIRLPSPILGTMNMLSAMVTPISMLIVGYSLTQANLKSILGDWRVYVVCFIRLILAPVAVFFLFSLFITDKTMLGVLTIAASMPVGANTGVLAELYDNNPVFASKNIFLSTILCLITIPLITSLLLSI